MFESTLHDIHQLSTQIQTNVNKILSEKPTIDKSLQSPPETHHRTLSHTPHVTKQKLFQNVNVRHFMAEEENQILKAEIQKLKAKQKENYQQIKDLKRYVKFLEKYNDDLKKQVVLWTTRPVKKEPQQLKNQIGDRFRQYRVKLAEVISKNSSQPIHIEQNFTERFSQSFNRHEQKKSNYSMFVKQARNDENPELESGKTQKIKLNYKHSSDFGHQKDFCTSCNYLEYSNKNKKSSSYFMKKKNPSSSKNTLKINKNQRRQTNFSFNANSQNNTNNLCQCHSNYMRKGKF